MVHRSFLERENVYTTIAMNWLIDTLRASPLLKEIIATRTIPKLIIVNKDGTKIEIPADQVRYIEVWCS